MQPSSTETRRGFFRDSSLWLAAALPTAGRVGHRDRIDLGLLGCDRRSVELVASMLSAFPTSRLVAIADRFPDRVQAAVRGLKSRFPAQFAVDKATRYAGPGAGERLAEMPADAVVAWSPPPCRAADLETLRHAGRDVYGALPIIGASDSVAARLTDMLRPELTRNVCIDPFGPLHGLLLKCADTPVANLWPIHDMEMCVEYSGCPVPPQSSRSDADRLWRAYEHFDAWGGRGTALRMQAIAVASALVADVPIEITPLPAEHHAACRDASADGVPESDAASCIESAWQVRFAHRQQFNLVLRKRSRPGRVRVHLVVSSSAGRHAFVLTPGERSAPVAPRPVSSLSAVRRDHRQEGPPAAPPGPLTGSTTTSHLTLLRQPTWYSWLSGNLPATALANRIAISVLAVTPFSQEPSA
ncbi:MAG: hypothetical protein D6753_14050 [Planctomycetota bacterium]|nr:MAG: hypothetical protein D6753_14050 [Planctomycetota bacterium]